MFGITTTAGLWVTYNTVLEYLDFEVITQVKIVNESPMDFPSVFFCIKNTETTSNISLKKLIKKCKFADRDCDVDSDIEYLKTGFPIFKDCMIFNGYINNQIKYKSDEVNLSSGLRIQFLYYPGSKFKIFITENNIKNIGNSVPLILENPDLYDITITKTVDRKLGIPYNNCSRITDLSYNRWNCIEKCIHDKVAYKYNCSMVGYYQVNNRVICSKKFIKRRSFSVQCEINCPEKCDSIIYEYSSREHDQNITFYFFRIYFSRLTYLDLKQIPKMTDFDLVNSIGGSLGLFVGFQFMSLIEILQYVIDVIFIMIY